VLHSFGVILGRGVRCTEQTLRVGHISAGMSELLQRLYVIIGSHCHLGPCIAH
jgi:hypothetical protein